MENVNRMILFAKVIENKSFSEAARRMNIGKSAVSMQITKLEEELGVRLLHRSTRKLVLTEAGEQYYYSCARILEEAELASEQIKNYKSEVSGKLKLTSPVGFGSRVITPIISEFMARYPDLEVDLLLSDENQNLAEKGLDLAIRIAELEDSSLIAKPLSKIPMILCASPAYVEKYGQPDSVAALNEHQWVLFSHTPTKIPYELNGEKYLIQPKGRIRVNNEQARLQLVLDGLGLSPMHIYDAWESLQTGKLMRISEHIPIPSTPVTALYQSRKYLPKKISVFIDFLKVKLDEEDWL